MSLVSTSQTPASDFPQQPVLPAGAPARRLELRRPELVRDFLREHDFLLPLIEEARVKLAEYFGTKTALALQVVNHPDDGASELFLYVQTALPTAEVLGTMDRFDEDWWLEKMPETRNRMVVSFEYSALAE